MTRISYIIYDMGMIIVKVSKNISVYKIFITIVCIAIVLYYTGQNGLINDFNNTANDV